MMKLNKVIQTGALALATLLMSSCFTSQDAVMDRKPRQSDKQEILVENAYSLSDLILRAPGVFLDYNTGVPTIRGGEPLYVLDGVRMGHSFYRVSNSVHVNDVASVEVLRNPSETLIYGRDVRFGVILIKTKVG